MKAHVKSKSGGRKPVANGISASTAIGAIRLYVDGMNLRRIARHLGVVHQTVANWVAAHIVASITSKPFPTTQLIS